MIVVAASSGPRPKVIFRCDTGSSPVPGQGVAPEEENDGVKVRMFQARSHEQHRSMHVRGAVRR